MSATVVKTNVEQLDNLVLQGKILDGVQQFFADNVHTQEGNGSKTSNKAETIKKLEGFFEGVTAVNSIVLHSQTVGDDFSMSEFTFDLAHKDGPLLWNEVLRRKWAGGKVVDERYYTAS